MIIASIIVILIIVFKMIYNQYLVNIERELTRKEFDVNSINRLYNYNKDKVYIDNILRLDSSNFYDDDHLKQLVYIAVKSGKRIRSVILLSISKGYPQLEHTESLVKNFICSIEYIHSSSLILDDIMDEDLYRRGDKCMYVEYGIPKTQLIALALFTRSIKLLLSEIDHASGSEICKNNRDMIYEVINSLEDCTIGQYLDLYGKNIDTASVLQKKTITLFEISYLMGWYSTNYNKSLQDILPILKRLSYAFGMLFQIADDFTDIERDKENNSKYNYVLNYGKKEALNLYGKSLQDWLNLSYEHNIISKSLLEVVLYLTKRTYDIYLSSNV